MTKSESIANLAAALCLAQAQFKIAIKGKLNPFFKSKYADLQTVRDAAHDGLAANGLSVVQLPSGTGDAVVLQTMLIHKSGEWICDEGVVMRPVPTKLDQSGATGVTPQGVAAAITYARRAGLQAVLGVIADEDDDGEQISRVPTTAPRAPRQSVTVTEAAPPTVMRAMDAVFLAEERADAATEARLLADCAKGWATWDDKRAWSKANKATKDALPQDAQERIGAAFVAASPVAKVTLNNKPAVAAA